RTINAIDLRRLDRHHDAAITSLIPALVQRARSSIGKSRKSDVILLENCGWSGVSSSMNWVRSTIRPFAHLALFALALQMIVSFGHMHPDDLGLPSLATAHWSHFPSGT